MAIKKRKKSKDSKIRVDKSSSNPPAGTAEDDEQGKKEGKAESVSAQNTATKDPGPKPQPKSPTEESKGLTGIAAYIEFLKQVRVEYRKITWPDRRQIIQETWTVLILVTFITLLVLGYDWVLGNIVFGPLEHWIKLNMSP